MSESDEVLLKTNRRMVEFAEYLAKDGNYLEGILVLKNILVELSSIGKRSPEHISTVEELVLQCNDRICSYKRDGANYVPRSINYALPCEKKTLST